MSPSNKGADLPIRGIVKAKISYRTAKLGKMYKVLLILSYTLALKMEQNVKNYSKKDMTESITLDISSSFNSGWTGRLKAVSVNFLALGQTAT